MVFIKLILNLNDDDADDDLTIHRVYIARDD